MRSAAGVVDSGGSFLFSGFPLVGGGVRCSITNGMQMGVGLWPALAKRQRSEPGHTQPHTRARLRTSSKRGPAPHSLLNGCVWCQLAPRKCKHQQHRPRCATSVRSRGTSAHRCVGGGLACARGEGASVEFCINRHGDRTHDHGITKSNTSN